MAKTQNQKKKKHPLLIILLVVVIIAIIGIVGSSDEPSGSQVTPAPTPAPTATPEPTPQINVPIIDYGKDLSRYTEALKELGTAIEKMEPTLYINNRARLDWSEIDPKYFWVSGVNDHMHYHDDRTFSGYLYLEYNCTLEDIPVMQAEINATVSQILSLIPANADNWQKAKIFHDELCRRVTYDRSLSGTHIRDIYGVFAEGSAVCVGYAYAFEYLCDQVGIPCLTIESEDRTHAWNQIKLDDSFHHYIDVTWDDPDLTDAYGNAYVLYNHFIMSQTEMEATGQAHDLIYDTQGEYLPENNYYIHEGYYLTEYSQTAVNDIFRKQYNAGSNTLTVRFASAEALQAAVDGLTGNSCQQMNSILSQLGYSGLYSYTTNDTMHTLTLMLNPAAE